MQCLSSVYLLYLFTLIKSIQSYPSLIAESRGDNPDERGGYFEGDMIMDRGGQTGRSGMKSEKSRWSDSTLVYSLHTQFGELEKQRILSAMNEIMSKTCIRFKERLFDERDFVFIRRGPKLSGCSSSIGRTGKRQILNLEPNCITQGVIMHELIHSLGFFHEHSRNDRDEYIDINYSNVLPGAEYNFQKHSSGVVDSFGIGYDYDSIMHYSAFAFALNGNEKTIKTRNGEAIGQRIRLSEKDVQKLNKMYKCEGKVWVFKNLK